jgi:hypothetical protein
MAQGRFWRILARSLLLAGWTLSTGCVSLKQLYPLADPPPEALHPCQELPRCVRDRVVIFLLAGLDPLDCADLSGLRQFLVSRGFSQVYFGQPYHSACFTGEIQRLHSGDPERRFVLIGHGAGAGVVRGMAHVLKRDGIVIDLLVYLDGGLSNVPRNRPDNVCRLINIRAAGLCRGALLIDADNVDVPDACHFTLPGHSATVQTLTDALLHLAGSIPYEAPAEPEMPHALSEAPTPRPTLAQAPLPRDEWDFLKPVTRLGGGPRDEVRHHTAARVNTGD